MLFWKQCHSDVFPSCGHGRDLVDYFCCLKWKSRVVERIETAELINKQGNAIISQQKQYR